MHNPFAHWPCTGSWADHMSYSLGGEDYPTPYGYSFEAPAAGTLRISGGSGEFKAGWVGSAGRRSILELDTPIGDLVAVVFQHQAAFGTPGHYDENDPGCGLTGASANGVNWGGDVHMHWHGLNAAGQRLPMSNYTSSSTAGGGSRPLPAPPEEEEEDEMAIKNSGACWVRADGVTQCVIFNTDSGFEMHHLDAGGSYNTALATAFGTDTWALISASHASNLLAALKAVRDSKASGTVVLEIPDPVTIDLGEIHEAALQAAGSV